MANSLRFGNEEFWLDATDAAEVQRLCVTDREAGLTLARRRAHRAAVHVPMMLMDAAPSAMPTPLHDAAPSPAPVQPPRTTTMSSMSKVTIGDATHYVDPAVYREIETLRGANAALTAIVQGNVHPTATRPVVDAVTAERIAAGMRGDALRAADAARRDPSTPYGSYLQYLENAHKANR